MVNLVRDGTQLFQTAIVDLTEREAAESALREKEAELEQIVTQTPFMLTRCTRDLRYRYVSQPYAKMVGRTSEEIAGKPIVEIMGEEGLALIRPYIERALSGETVSYESLVPFRNSPPRFLHAVYVPDKDEGGKIVGWIASLIDISERKKAEEKLAWLAAYPRENPNPIMELDLETKSIYYANPASYEAFPDLKNLGPRHPFLRRMLELARPLLKSEAKPIQTEININGSAYAVAIVRVPHTRRLRVYSVDITGRKRVEEQQRVLYQFAQRQNTAASLSDIYDAALDAIIACGGCDRASILLFDKCNVMRFVAWRRLSEKYRKAIEGHSPWKPDAKNPEPICIGDVDLASLPKNLKSSIKREGIHAAAFVPLVANRKLIGQFMSYYDEPHVFTDAEISLAVTVGRQLTLAIEHQRADEDVRESEARMRAIVEQATAGMARCDTSGRMIFVNKRFCQMLGYEQSELVGKTIREITHPDDAGSFRFFERMIRDGKPFEIEKRYLRKNGSILWADVSASPVRDKKGRTQSAVAVVVDVTARKKAEAALKQSKELLEKLVQQRTKALRTANVELQSEIVRRKGLEGQILEISDREQERLGQELHDGLCQQLTAIGFLARATSLRLRNHRVVQVDDLERIAKLINGSVMDARNIARDLHKEEIDAAEFVQALRDLAERKIWKTLCRFDLKTEIEIEDDNVASQLYRILREAIINANKHARAKQIVLEIKRSGNDLVFSVTDDGVGLNPKGKLGQGLGFHIMKYRAGSIGARLEFGSLKKGGTRMAVYLPIGQ